MSGYSSGEALVLTQLRAVSGFSANADPNGISNTSRGDYSILNTGVSQVYGIIVPGESKIEQGTTTVFFNRWNTVIQIWQQYIDDGTTLTALEANVDLVIARFLAYRKLGDTSGIIQDSNPRTVGKPQEMWIRGGDGPAWLRQDVNIEWIEEQQVTYA